MEINIQHKNKDALVSRAFQQLPICNYTIFCIATTNGTRCLHFNDGKGDFGRFVLQIQLYIFRRSWQDLQQSITASVHPSGER